MLPAEGGGEEAAHGQVGDGGHAFLPDGPYPLVPCRGIHRRRSADQHEAGQTVGSGLRDLHADHPAERHPGEAEPLEPRRVGNGQYVGGKSGQSDIAGLSLGRAMSARIDAEQPEPFAQRGQDGIPQVHLGPNGIQQDQLRGIFGPVHLPIEAAAGNRGEGRQAAPAAATCRGTKTPVTTTWMRASRC